MPGMKAAFVTRPSEITVREMDEPRPGAGDVMVRMDACGICGSDIEKVFGRYGKPSMRLGHEPAGTILAAGDAVKDLVPGDRVFTHHHVPCYTCHHCTHGNETMCPRYSESNLSPCGLSQTYMVPEWNVAHGGILKLPESMTFEEAAMIEPLACCVRSWGKIRHKPGDSVAILGAGPTGMMHVMLAQNLGFGKIFCLDVNEFRLDFARNLGVTGAFDASDPSRIQNILSYTSGRGVDVAIVATSNPQAFRDAVGLARSGGTILMFGVPPGDGAACPDMGAIYSKELTIVTSYAASDLDTRRAMELIHSGEVDAKKLITHRYPLSDSQKAFDHARSGRDSMKIIITR